MRAFHSVGRFVGCLTSMILLASSLPCFGQTGQIAQITNQMTLSAGGWNINGSNVISFTATSGGPDTLNITCMENFSSNTYGLLMTFLQTSSSPDTIINFTSETIGNDTGTNWSGFDFYLLTSLNGPAKLTNEFLLPTGYTGETINLADDSLNYTGSQPNGSVVTWGSSRPGDFLQINAPVGTTFTLKQLPVKGSPSVPEPASVATLLTVGGSVLLGRRRR